MSRIFVSNVNKFTLDRWAFLCYIITMRNESIFKITIATCWETSKTRAEFVKARDTDHALRIANNLWGNVISAQFTCEDNFS